jgi:hypothetical protein
MSERSLDLHTLEMLLAAFIGQVVKLDDLQGPPLHI